MLKHLKIKNYALIKSIEIDFIKGLTVLTGETGAGKSIVVGALSLLLGQRADSKSILDKSRKCIIEGVFDVKDYNLKQVFDSLDLDYDDECIVRREISAEGKSRAFINDTPTGLSELKKIALHLVYIHSQHENLRLNSDEYQLSILDVLASNDQVKTDFKSAFKQYEGVRKKLQTLKSQEKTDTVDLDYFQFQLTELEEFNLNAVEDSALDERFQALSHSDEIKSTLINSVNLLDGQEQSVNEILIEISKSLSTISKYESSLLSFSERINSVHIELEDLVKEFTDKSEEFDLDTNELAQISGRLDRLNLLMKKQKVSTVSELSEVQKQLEDKVGGFNNLEEEIVELEKQLSKEWESLKVIGETLTESRRHVLSDLKTNVEGLLSQMGMPMARLELNFDSSDENLSVSGFDRIRILFSANTGVAPQEIHKVASGGELSRLMLSLQSLMASFTALPTIIFDEVDTGVSGDIAQKIGFIMKKMAIKHQVLAITHLPQIASQGNEHMFVFKKEENGMVQSSLRKLEDEDRVIEIAKMLSGESPTTHAINNAKDLLAQG
ncbi:MAG: DNA repair protein RecN (Recombination protein N) [Sphingobacteriales bacterium]|jgi:DNA repair protein RecN (Recombination protein N)